MKFLIQKLSHIFSNIHTYTYVHVTYICIHAMYVVIDRLELE